LTVYDREGRPMPRAKRHQANQHEETAFPVRGNLAGRDWFDEPTTRTEILRTIARASA
jgi:hypothetical protein